MNKYKYKIIDKYGDTLIGYLNAFDVNEVICRLGVFQKIIFIWDCSNDGGIRPK